MDISTLDYLTTGRLLDIDQTIFRARMDGIRAALYGSEGDRRRYTDLIEGVKAFQATYRRLSGSPCPKARSEGFRDELKDMNGVVQNRTSCEIIVCRFGSIVLCGNPIEVSILSIYFGTFTNFESSVTFELG